MKTINTLFNEAIQYDVSYAADYIYFAVTKGKLLLDDSSDKLQSIELLPNEQQEFEEMRAKDMMKLRQMKLYAIWQNDKTYAFYFGKSVEEAAKLHEQRTKQKVAKIYNCYNQMIDKAIYFPDTNRTKTFREILKETHEFPCFVLEMEGWGE